MSINFQFIAILAAINPIMWIRPVKYQS